MNTEKNSPSKRFASVWAAAFVMTAQSVPLAAMAETPSSPQNLNLSSTMANVTATKSGTVQIGGQVNKGTVSGGTSMSVVPGQLLTPAANAALWQSAVGGNQQLLVNGAGAAVGGSMQMHSSWAGNLSSLVVPTGVTVNAVGFNAASPLNVTGSANILGSLHALQNVAGLTAILNFGNNLNIAQGGLLTGNLPTNMNLPGLFSSQNLVVNVLGELSNSGTVSAIGDLNLNVTGNLSNVSLPGASANISAQNVNILSGSGSVINSGLISALNNLNINTMDALSNLNVDNTGGTLKALGDINLRAPGSAGVTTLTGGDWLSENINFKSEKGTLSANVNEVTGTINVEACIAQVYANTKNLEVGAWNLSGDPVIANSGDIDIKADIKTSGAPLTMVAGGNVRTTVAGLTISTSSATGNGGAINIFAGAKFSPDPYTAADETAGVPITITGPSASGGNIDLFTSGPIVTVSSKSTAAVGDGGNITMAAFEGGTAGSGKIILPYNSTVASGGNGDAGPGFIFLVAGASTNDGSQPGIFVGNLDSSGGFHVGETGLAGGHQVITTEQPNISAANPMVIDVTTGVPLQGGVLGGKTANSPIEARSIKTEGGQIIVLAGLGITVGDAGTIGTKVVDTAPPSLPGGMVTLIANAAGSTTQATDININGNINTSGSAAISGPVAVLTGGNFSSGDINTSNTSASGNAASILIVAGGNPFSGGGISVGDLDTSAKNGDAGNVEINIMSLSNMVTGSINTSSASNNGGAISLSAPGIITVQGNINSSGAINGGSVFIASGLGFAALPTIKTMDIDTSTSSSSPTDFAGSVYLLSVLPTPLPSTGTITQTQPAGTATQNILSYTPNRNSILGSEGTVNLNFTNGVTPLEYVPGGYNIFDDQSGTAGGTNVNVNIGNNDPNLIVPLISLNAPMKLLGATGNTSSILLNASGNSSFSLISPNAINVGSNSASIESVNPVPVALIASTMGGIDVNNSSSSGQALVVGAAMAASDTLSIASNLGLTTGPVLNAYANGTSVSLDALGPGATLNINYNITFGSSVELMPTGTGNISQNINIFPSVIGGGAAVVGNSNMTGNISGPLSLDVTRTTINSDPDFTTNTFNILNVGNVNLDFNTGAILNLTAGSTVIVADSSATSPNLVLGSLTVAPGVTMAASSGDMTINTSQLTNGGTISASSSNDVWIFPDSGTNLTVSGANGSLSGDNIVFGLSPAGGGTITANQLLFDNTSQIVYGNAGHFAASDVVMTDTADMTVSGGINIDTPVFDNSGSLTANGTIDVTGVSPNPGPVGIFMQNQTASAGITVSGTGGTFSASTGGIYIQSLFPNGIVLDGTLTFNGETTLNDAGDDGVTVNAGAVIDVNGDLFVATSHATINGQLNFNEGGTIFSSGDIDGTGLLTALSGTLSLVSFGGNIGSLLVPLEVSSGNSGVNNLNLDVFAPSGLPNTGNVFLIDNDADPGLVGNPAVFLNAVAGSGEGVATAGNFFMQTPNGSIGIHPDELRASSNITLVAGRSIIQKHGETIIAPVINLTAINGNIGLSETSPTLVSSGNSGITQLTLNVNAKANTSGNGNIWVSSPDLNITWGVPNMAVALGASQAGSGVPVDSTTGNFQLTTTAGGVVVTGAVSASTEMTFNSNGSILQGTGGSLASPTIRVTSTTGNIGSSAAPLLVSSGASGTKALNLFAVATANTNNNGNVWLIDNDADLGPVANPALLMFGEAGSGFSSAFQSGTFSMTMTQGTIGIHPTTLTASRQITLTADQSIIQLHGEVVQAPIISLTATKGNIGLPVSIFGTIPFIVSSGNSGNTQLRLTVSAPANTIGNGNVLLTVPDSDLLSGAPALILGASAAGSGTPIDFTTGNMNITTSAGGIGYSGAITAKSSLVFTADTNVLRLSGGTLSSPKMDFTATNGNIGLITTPIISDASDLVANAEGNVFLRASSNSLTLGASSGNTFVLTTTGAKAITTLNAINANNLTLQALSGTDGAFEIGGQIGGQHTPNASSVVINAAGAGHIINLNGLSSSVNTNTLSMSSGTGTIGIFLDGIVTNAGTVSANTNNKTGNEGIFISDSNPNVILNESTSGNWFELVAIRNVTVNGPITAGDSSGIGSLIISNGGDITLNASLISLNTDPDVDGIVLQTDNYGFITQNSGTLNTAGAVIIVDAGFGDIGSAAKPVSISGATSPVNLNFASVNNAYFSSPNVLRVFNGIGNDIHLTAANGVIITGLTTVNNLDIKTTNSGNVVFDDGSLTLFTTTPTDASSVKVSVNGTATITSNKFNLNATDSLILTATTGNIGSQLAPITTTAGFVSASTQGNVFIDDSFTGTVLLGNSAANDFTLNSAGGIKVTGTLNVSGSLNLNANTKDIFYNGSANVHDLVLSAPLGTITFPSAQISVMPDSSGNGGSLTLTATRLAVAGVATFSDLSISARGSGTGDGGSISVTLNSSTPVLINNVLTGKNPPPTQVMALDSSPLASGGKGGTISVTTGGNLTVFPAFLSAAAANGAGPTFVLNSGANLLVNGPLNANAAVSGVGGSITLQSNSLSSFTIGGSSATPNAIVKSSTCPSCSLLSVNGAGGNANGSITVRDINGGILNNVAIVADAITLTAGGAGSVVNKQSLGSSVAPFTTSITLNALGSGNVTSTSTKIQAGTITLASATGSVGTATTPVQFTAGTINASAPGINGVINITDLSTGNITLGTVNAGKSFKMSATKSPNVSNTVAATAPVFTLISTLGSIGTSGAHLQINSPNVTLTATKGLVAVDNLSVAPSTLNKSTGLSFTYTSAGSLSLAGIKTNNGAISVIAAGPQLVTQPSAVVTTKNGSIILQNNDNTAAGTITLGKSSKVITTGTGAKFPVSILVGAGGTTSTTNPLPATIKVVNFTGGTALFPTTAGSPGLSANAPINTVNLKGSDVTINSGANGSIFLNGGTTITADPVVVRAPKLSPNTAQQAVNVSFANTSTPSVATKSNAVPLPEFSLHNIVQNNAVSSQSFSWLGSSARDRKDLSTIRSQGAQYIGSVEAVQSELEVELQDGKIQARLISGKDADKHYALDKGAALFAPSSDTVVNTAFGQVRIDADSLVLVIAFANGVAVYDIHDEHRNAVSVNAEGHEIVLSPASQAIITSSQNRLDQVNPAQSFAYRNISEFELGSGLKAIKAEFSLGRALGLLLPLKQLSASSCARERRIFSNILKNAAIMHQMHSSRGRYEQHSRPRRNA